MTCPYLPLFKSDKGLKGIVVNRTSPYLNGGSLEITLTVPLKEEHNFQKLFLKSYINKQLAAYFRALRPIFTGELLREVFSFRDPRELV